MGPFISTTLSTSASSTIAADPIIQPIIGITFESNASFIALHKNQIEMVSWSQSASFTSVSISAELFANTGIHNQARNLSAFLSVDVGSTIVTVAVSNITINSSLTSSTTLFDDLCLGQGTYHLLLYDSGEYLDSSSHLLGFTGWVYKGSTGNISLYDGVMVLTAQYSTNLYRQNLFNSSFASDFDDVAFNLNGAFINATITPLLCNLSSFYIIANVCVPLSICDGAATYESTVPTPSRFYWNIDIQQSILFHQINYYLQ
jgi:hypothetical protein